MPRIRNGKRHRPSQGVGRRGFFVVCRSDHTPHGRRARLRRRRPRCGRLSPERPLRAAGRAAHPLFPVVLQAVDRLRRRGCAGRRAAHGGAQCTADAAGGIPGALYLSGSAGRTGRRRGGTAARDDDRAGGRPPAPCRSGRMARRERIRAGGFRLRAGAVLSARRHRRRLLLRREPALSVRLFRRGGRLDPAVQHFEPAVAGQVAAGRDHSQPQCARRRTGVARRGGGRRVLLVFRCGLRPAARGRSAAADARRGGRSRRRGPCADQPPATARRAGREETLRGARYAGRAAGDGRGGVPHGAATLLQQKFRAAGRRPFRRDTERVSHLYIIGEQGPGRTPAKYFPPGRPRRGGLHAGVAHAARGVRRPYAPSLLLYRPPALRSGATSR